MNKFEICSYHKNIKFLFIPWWLVTAMVFLNAGEMDKSRPWTYASILDATIGASHSNFCLGNFAIGILGPSYKFGLGITFLEKAGYFWSLSESPTIRYLPLSVFYIPYTRYTKSGLGLPVVYTCLSMGWWPMDYSILKLNLGVSIFCGGFEIGGYTCIPSIDEIDLYAGFKISLGGWFRAKGKGENH